MWQDVIADVISQVISNIIPNVTQCALDIVAETMNDNCIAELPASEECKKKYRMMKNRA